MVYGRTLLLAILLLASFVEGISAKEKGGLRELSKTRAVFQTEHGDIHLAFYPNAAPKTVELVLKLIELGAYNTNHFFTFYFRFIKIQSSNG